MNNFSEIKSFVNKIKPLQQEQHALSLHTSVVDKIQRFCQSDAFQTRIEAEQSNNKKLKKNLIRNI